MDKDDKGHSRFPLTEYFFSLLYEIILGRALDRRNFRKRIQALGLLRGLRRQRRGRHRPAQLYAFTRREPMNVRMLQPRVL